ncbi:MAG: ACP S-malonyltransferase [Anaerolineales bacterium]|jgi:[acyl-carrier-protein] S-malonyltransferase|nr:ACP S-malonyltransferase [Anaerolineales bacterium]
MTITPAATAFVFPGQGSQALGMGRALAAAFPEARQTFEEADDSLGFSLSKLIWEGPEAELNDTLNTQPALFTHSLAAYRVFCARQPGLAPAYMAGHSLGQLSAIAAAGALSFADGLQLVRRRGELMKRAGEQNPGGMAAILNLDIPTLDRLCGEASAPGEIVQVANDNSPGQVVISGATPALERALELAKAAGARRVIPLAVSIAAHSPLMACIAPEWDQAVRDAKLSDALIPVVGNVACAPLTRADDLRADLLAQMTSRVRWTESVRWLYAQGVTTFVETGTGAALAGLVRRIEASAQALPLGNPADFDGLV